MREAAQEPTTSYDPRMRRAVGLLVLLGACGGHELGADSGTDADVRDVVITTGQPPPAPTSNTTADEQRLHA